MLKELFLLALTGFCLTQAMMTETRTADVNFIQKQKKIYELFMFMDQAKVVGSEWYEIGRNFDIESNMEMYKDKMVVREFLYRFRLGMLRRDALFTVFNKEHRDELRVMFKLLYSAKDFMTFYKTACWCRLYMNRGMFVTALTTVCMYRDDCKKIMLPPLYEVYPHLFFDNEIIQEAHRLKMMTGTKSMRMIDNVDTYMIDRNMTTTMMMRMMDKEYQLDYFMNDVELNNYYFFARNLFPFWITLKHIDVPKHIRGEFYYYIHQQLLARFRLERMSVGLNDMEDLNVDDKIIPGFFSTLVYGNGVIVPSRDRWTNVPIYKYKYVKEIKIIEKRILDAIDSGMIMDKDGKLIHLYTTEGLNILGNLIEGNGDSCNTRLYGAIEVLYRDLLGINYDCKHKHCIVPSAMQMFKTNLRDPVFYRMCKIITGFFLRYKCHLPTYTMNELDFSGVMFEDIMVDKLVTYMDKCEYSIKNVITVDNMMEGMKWDIKTKHMCLKHKPFTYNMMIKSDRNVKGMVRIYLGPSNDEHMTNKRVFLHEKWYDFVELDKFTVDLTVGMNTIKRLNTDCMHCMDRTITGNMMYKKLLKAVEGSEPFTMMDKFVGWPTHLYLPRGRVGGMSFKLFVIITPIDETQMTVFDFPMFGKMMWDGKPFGFPLDRPIMPWMIDLKNIWMKDVWIHHMDDLVGFNMDMMMHRNMDDRMMMQDKIMMRDRMMTREDNIMNIRDTVRNDKFMTHDMGKDRTFMF